MIYVYIMYSQPLKKRYSDPFHEPSLHAEPSLLVEPSPNLVALRSQLTASKQLLVITSDRIK